MMSAVAPALLGGACLGVSSVVVLAQTGGILGVSGIVGGLLGKQRRRQPWRWAFLGGLLAGARVALRLHPTSFTAPTSTFAITRAVVGGALIGAGAALGHGCTSGHGVCGVSRLSKRSIAFISVAMAAGGLAATLSNAAAAIPAAAGAVGPPSALMQLMLGGAASLMVAPAVARAAAGGRGISGQNEDRLKTAVYGAAGFVFALGLSVSGMLSAANVVAFLSPTTSAFDPRLMAVMAAAVGVAILPFQTISRWRRAKEAGLISQEIPKLPAGGGIDRKLLAGAVLFGTGWGLTGMCPGPALANLVRLSSQVLVAVGAMLAGMAAVHGVS